MNEQERERRRQEILRNAFQLFIEQGYADVTYQKIADKCGITRTTLYLYFRNKREIFLWSIKQLLGKVESEMKDIMADATIDSVTCLRKMLLYVLDCMEENRNFFIVLKMYLIQAEKRGANISEKIARRVVRFQHILTTVILRGQKAGEMKALNIKNEIALLYHLLETAALRLGVLGLTSVQDTKDTVLFALDGFKTE